MTSVINEDNPLGILDIDHLEFCCEKRQGTMRELFYTFGFSSTYLNTDESCELLEQGQVRFLLNSRKEGHSHSYLKAHGEGVSTMSFLVENAEHALTEAQKRGAEIVQDLQTEETEHGTYRWGKIQGFGDVHNEFIERPRSFFRPGYRKLAEDKNAKPLKTRMARIDHLTNNVPKGEMKKWVEFYQKIYGFKITRYFDIKGQKTGLFSEVVQLANGRVIIPINEPEEEKGKSQIQEFLDLHKGAGVQHIALSTPQITETVEDLQARGVEFLKIPNTYYEDIPKRGINVEEDLGLLEKRQLLVDGNEKGYLLQNFTKPCIGPSFFEIIQRKNNNGFGEGNFQALFDAIERDQVQRGYLKEE